jgi:hypothetical protein
MSENPEANDERPCLHCLIGDLISEFYAEYGSLSGGMDTIRQWTTSKRAGSDNSDLPRPGRDAGGHRIQKGMPRPLSPAADMPPRKLRQCTNCGPLQRSTRSARVSPVRRFGALNSHRV